jgi:4-amino-4-deoxy-L-arabinose transferase-like glycosyltransferase
MTDLHKSKPFVWALFLIFSLVWLYALGLRTLVPTDEGRYAEMAREMVATGDWITTRLNGIKYFEKPPLQTWMNALTFELFGLGDWQARLWTGLSGLFGIVLTAYAGRQVFGGRVALYAALVLGSSFWWAGLGHINTLDMGLSGMMTLAMCGLLIAQRDAAGVAERRNWMLACWAGMALAVLSKGLIGLVLPGAVLVLYTLITRDWAIWRRLHLGKGLLLFFAICTPWFWLVSQRNPEFPHFFFIHEHVERFLTKTHHREGPWYYFIPLLLVGVVPWLGVLPQSLWAALRPGQPAGSARSVSSAASTQSTDARPAVFRPLPLLLIWAGFIFFFFSYSSSKLPSYILPIFPALALLMAVYLEKAKQRHLMIAAGLLAAMGAMGLPFLFKLGSFSHNPLETKLVEAFAPWILATCVLLLVGGIAALVCARQSRRDLAVLILAWSGFLAGQLLFTGSEGHGRYRAGLDLVPAIEAELTPQTKLYAVGMYDQTLPFYLRRTMILVGHKDELEFGLQQEPQLWVPTMDAFIAQWRAGPKAIAVTRAHIYADLKQRGVPMRVLAEDSRRIVITNDVGK